MSFDPQMAQMGSDEETGALNLRPSASSADGSGSVVSKGTENVFRRNELATVCFGQRDQQLGFHADIELETFIALSREDGHYPIRQRFCSFSAYGPSPTAEYAET